MQTENSGIDTYPSHTLQTRQRDYNSKQGQNDKKAHLLEMIQADMTVCNRLLTL